MNRWQVAICEQLKKSREPLSTAQIWEGMAAAGFQHKSVSPRQTLGARLAELVAQGDVKRVGPSLYQIGRVAETSLVNLEERAQSS